MTRSDDNRKPGAPSNSEATKPNAPGHRPADASSPAAARESTSSPRHWPGSPASVPPNAADNNPDAPAPADDPARAITSVPGAEDATHLGKRPASDPKTATKPQADFPAPPGIKPIPPKPPETLTDEDLAKLTDADDPAVRQNLKRILTSPSYRVAMNDLEFLHSPALRPLRLELELLKVELTLEREKIESTIVVFGGTQLVSHAKAAERLRAAKASLAKAPADPARQREAQISERVLAKSHYYEEALRFSQMVSSACQNNDRCDYVIVTGGGPGIMEAANRGAYEVGAKSVGLNITLPEEQAPNPYITPELCFQFHYFALRKMHFLMRAKALVVFPGGYGTLDELFEVLTLRQTGRMQPIPIILCGREYWHHVVNFQYLADEGVIRDEHLELLQFVDTAAEAWDIIQKFHAEK